MELQIFPSRTRQKLASVIALLAIAFGGQNAAYASEEKYYDTSLLPLAEAEFGEMITVFAEKNSERRYAERFAEMVYEAAYETTGEPAGKGLIIIGNYDQPHPILIVKKYLDINYEGDEAIDSSPIGIILRDGLAEWREAEKGLRDEVGIELDSVIYVLPTDLEGFVFNLYMVAKEEAFDDKKMESRFENLELTDIVNAEYEKFDWMVYLPPRNAIDKVIKQVLPAVMKKEKVGFFQRALVRGAVFTFKPIIRDAMEGVRKATLYRSILEATSDLNEGDIEALANVYTEALMPKGKIVGGKKQDRSLEAIREQKRKNAAYALDPYIAPEETIELDPVLYSKYEGEYFQKGRPSVSIYQEQGALFFKRGNNDPFEIKPASETLFVTENGKMTVEFLADPEGAYSRAELRRERWRRTLTRKTGD